MLHNLRKPIAAFLLLVLGAEPALAFCGFYVSKADGTLKNKTSQVILVHDGDRNVITMYNDFKGNTRDFAMVVPVPVVLRKDDIRVIEPAVFSTLNDYSKPRLVEYYDGNPCARVMYDVALEKREVPQPMSTTAAKDLGVRIEAKYLVGEYDILILSAKQSSGLRTWLTQNGYHIPAGADEVLEPYIRSNLKFFVVKVNEAEKEKLAGNFLRPIQISFRSPKFMLPIRLGMANGDGDQDLLVYAFTRRGRVECTNYRTVAMPTGQELPLFVQKDFGRFYGNTFTHTWQREGQAVSLLEYAWDVSPHNYVKCDPCVAEAPSAQDLVQAGVWWLNENGSADNVFFTRLHYRYNRRAFPQDLVFQETPNTAAYQARYVITHPASGERDCPEWKAYRNKLRERRQRELRNLHALSGESYKAWARADLPETGIDRSCSYAQVDRLPPDGDPGREWWLLGGLCVGAILTAWGTRREV
ncbi:DUF2330 domain-containing protein [Flaviaesturariibacter flavus]|uniref:DUF2330 domain-containing protein n=1 Tax=Flaviaesturariibacter flavus TaxID=2502780 RepID=A0A4R1B8P5_9BACT|nr:DUF2330 domain-containing protein [Flaviaesturariibacter flavus]TCJ13145.1 DUF2330 domain-containing protein [Flaviaesturariibacter flavus]